MARSSEDPRVRALVKIIEAKGKKAQADNKLRTEILKLKAASQIRMQEAQTKERMKFQSPEQQYLQRRFREQNPLAELYIPEEGAEDLTVSFPSSKVEPGPNGQLREMPIPASKEPIMFITKYNKMLEEGKTPHPSMKAVYDKYFNKVNPPKKAQEEDLFSQFEDLGDSEDATPKSPNIFARIGNALFKKVNGGWSMEKTNA